MNVAPVETKKQLQENVARQISRLHCELACITDSEPILYYIHKAELEQRIAFLQVLEESINQIPDWSPSS